MGGGQGKAANGSEYLDACDHTPIFRCFDGLDSAEQSQQFKEQVASFFHRQSIPAGASVFDHKVGRRDLVIVEKGGLTMVSCHGEDKTHKKDRPVIKHVQQGEMMGMMELVRNVEQERDTSTGEYPVDVVADAKTHVLVLSQDVYLSQLVANRDHEACRLFCDNLMGLTRAAIVNWLKKVVVLRDVAEKALEELADVAHFQSMPADTVLIEQHAKVPRLYVVLSGVLKVTCEASSKSPRDRAGDTGAVEVGQLLAGDFFGESSLLNAADKDQGLAPISSTASVTTASECLFIYFESDAMKESLLKLPDVKEKIQGYIKDRLSAQLVAMNLGLFNSMRPASIALFTADLSIVNLSDGDVVFEKDSEGDDFYIIIEGAVKIEDGENLHVALSRKGDYFGEVALVRSEPRAATVTATAPTSLARVRGSNFQSLCLQSPSVAAEFEIKALGTKASVGALLLHPSTAPLLKKTLDDEFSSENYHCWGMVEEYRGKIDTGAPAAETYALAKQIRDRFITTDTEELINISAKADKHVKKYFADVDEGDPKPPRDLYDPVLKCISNNLRGNLQRFCVTKEYKAVLASFDTYTPRGRKKK